MKTIKWIIRHKEYWSKNDGERSWEFNIGEDNFDIIKLYKNYLLINLNIKLKYWLIIINKYWGTFLNRCESTFFTCVPTWNDKTHFFICEKLIFEKVSHHLF